MPRSWKPPLRIRRVAEGFRVDDAAGLNLTYTYFDDNEATRMQRGRVRSEDAREIAQAVARALTELAKTSDG